ncbi:excalibur calcium-binding domain-containing protein [Rhodococcus oryzae]|uniref:excalibur calcium-binding domain-containing protein n=1 Tax=Rhodococcus oryzae TaxID=2571143 RepID=UPI0037BCD548
MTNPGGPPPGWYPDPEPSGAAEFQRYWNGDEWTLTTRPVPPDSTATTLIPVIPAEPEPEPEPEPAAKKKSKTVPLLAAGAVAVAVLAVTAGVMGSATSEPASSPTISRTVPTTTARPSTPARSSVVPAPAKPAPLVEMPKPTTYVAPAPVTTRPPGAAPAPAYVPDTSERRPTPPPVITKPQPLVEAPSPSGKFDSCDDAIAAGAAPMYKGDPGYSTKLDRDKDGIACDK